ncbi:hypothetical protein [Minwuia sp.]|uniref:hypothetical protein n=1 Tax=Minwuia sp. TaxID=2493630 RepID=UPI003A9271A1
MLLKWTGNRVDGADVPAESEAASGSSVAARRRKVALLLTGVTIAWFAVAILYFSMIAGLGSLLLMLPHEVALVLLAVILPPMFAWLVGAVFWRGFETERSRAALLEVLSDVSGPDAEAEARLNAAAMALRRMSQSVETELSNALARSDELNRRIETGTQQMSALAQQAGARSAEVSGLVQDAASQQRQLLTDLQALGEQTREMGRTDANQLAAAVEAAARRASEISVALDAKAKAMTETVEMVTRRAHEIGAVVDQPMTRLREDSEQTVRRLNNASQELRNRVEGLNQEIVRTAEQAGHASQGVEGSAVRLRAVGTEMRSALAEAGDAVGTRTEELRALVSGAIRSSDQAAQRLDQRLSQFAASLDSMNVSAGETEEVLSATADRMGSAVDRFADQVSSVRELAGETVDQTDAAAASVMEAGAALGASARQIVATQERFARSHDEITATITHLSGVAEEGISALEERIREAASFAQAAAERSGGTLDAVVTGIGSAARDLNRQIALMEQQARQSEAQGSGTADILALRLGELKSVLSEVQAETARSHSGMKSLTESSGELLAELSRTVGGLNRAVSDTVERTDRAVGDVGGSVRDLEDATVRAEGRLTQLSDAVADRADSFDAVAERMREAAAGIERDTATRMETVADRVETITEVAEQAYGKLSGSLTALFSDLEQRAEQMTGSVSRASDQSAAAGDRLNEASAELALILKDIDHSVTGAGESFGALDQRVRDVALTIRAGVEQNLAALEARGQTVTANLLDGSADLTAASEELERRSASSLQRLTAARAATVTQVDEMETRLANLSEAWGTRAALLDNAAEKIEAFTGRIEGETADRLAGFTARLSEATGFARATVRALDDQRALLTDTSAEIGEKLNGVVAGLEQRMVDLASASDDTVERLKGRIDALEAQAAKLGSTSDDIADTAGVNAERLQAVLTGLGTASQSLNGKVAELIDAAETGSVLLADRGEAMGEKGAAVLTSLSRSADGLSGQGDRISALLTRLSAEAQQSDASLSETMSAMADKVRESTELARITSDTLLSGTDALVAEAGRVHTDISATTADLQQRIETIRIAGGQTAERIAGAASEIEIRTSALQSLGQETEAEILQRAQTVADRMQSLTDLNRSSQVAFEDSARSIAQSSEVGEARARAAVAAMQEAVAALEAALPRASGLQVSAEALKETGQSVTEIIGKLETGSRDAIERLSTERDAFAGENRRMADEVGSGLSRFNATLEETRARMSAFVSGEQKAAETAEAVAARLDSQLERTEVITTRFDEKGAALDRLLSDRIAAVEAAEQRAAEAATLLAESFEREQARLSEMRDLTVAEREAFGASTAAALDDLRARASDFLDHVRTLNAAADALRADLGDATDRISKDVATASEAGAKIAGVAEQSAQSLMRQREAFAGSVEQAEQAARRARKALGEQATAIASASQAATMQSGLATRAFEGQAARLDQSARKAAETARDLDEKARTDRDRRFLQSASYVAEGLNSLALDLHRILDSEDTEAQWQKYYRGDRGLFARRLVSRANRREIARLYEGDGDFRRNVDLYLNEFESVMLAVDESDHEGLLLSVFLSADVGKLYLVLCEALDRKPASRKQRSSR